MVSGVVVAYCIVKPKFHYANFHRNFPAGKVRDTNHVADFHDLCPRLCRRISPCIVTVDKRILSQKPRHVEMACVDDFHDLSFRLSSRGGFGESRRNGIWTLRPGHT